MPYTLCNIFLLCHLILSTEAIRRFYMEEDCGGTIDMPALGIPAGRLSVSRRSKYRKTLDCDIRVVAGAEQRLVLVFTELDVEWEPRCDDDFVQFFDGETMKSPIISGLPPRVCGHKTPRGNFVTTQNVLTVYFRSDIYKEEDGFEIVFTSFHKGRCDGDEVRCNNGRCVAASLKCNDFDNCGDNSDECAIDTSTLVGIVSSVFLLSVIGIGSAMVCQRKRRTARERKRKESMLHITPVVPVAKYSHNPNCSCQVCRVKYAPPTSGSGCEAMMGANKDVANAQWEVNCGICLAEEMDRERIKDAERNASLSTS